MFTVEQEFTFSIQENESVKNFIGVIILKGNKLNEYGSLNTFEEFNNFTNALNSSLELPQVNTLTLEILSQILYFQAKACITNIYSLQIRLATDSSRKAEYGLLESYTPLLTDVIDGEILEPNTEVVM